MDSKNNENYGDDGVPEDREGHRLNHVYQGSLRETGSTSRPRHNGDDYTDSSSSLKAHPIAICILLIASYHLTRFT